MRILYLVISSVFFVFNFAFSSDSNPKLVALKSQLKNTKNELQRVEIYRDLLILNKSDSLDLLAYKNKIEDYALKFKAPHWQAEAAYWYAKVYSRTGDVALPYYQLCIAIGKQTNNDTLIAKGNLGTAIVYYSQQKLDLCNTHIDKAISKMQSYKQSRLKAEILNCKAAYYYQKGDQVNFVKYELESQKAVSEIGWKKHELRIHNNLAASYINQGNYTAALARLYKALKICEKTENYEIMITVLHNISRLYRLQEKYENAIEFTQKAMIIAQKTKVGRDISFVRKNLGALYYALKKYEKAKQEYIIVFDAAKTSNNIPHLTESSVYLALINLKEQGKGYETYLEVAKKNLKSTQNKYLKSLMFHLLGEFYFLKKDYSKSIKYLKHALALRYEINDYSRVKKTIGELSKAYNAIGNYKQAYYYNDRYIKITDSLQKVSYVTEITRKSLEHDFDKEKVDLKRKSLIAQTKSAQKLKQQKTITYLILIFLILIIGITFYVYKLYRKKQMLSLKLIAQKRQLARLNRTKDKIFSVIGHDLRTPLSLLSFLTNLVDSDDMNLKDIKKSFVSINTLTNGIRTSLENVFHWGQSQMNGISVCVTKVNVLEVLQKIKPVLEMQLNNKLITLKCEVNKDFYVKSDENQLQIILRNLLSNAIKFSAQNTEIKVFCEAQGDKYQITIADEGVGMDEETKNSVFNDVANKSKNGTDGETGTGLGLMLCKEFVEKNKGKIWVESALNVGTKMHVILPSA